MAPHGQLWITLLFHGRKAIADSIRWIFAGASPKLRNELGSLALAPAPLPADKPTVKNKGIPHMTKIIPEAALSQHIAVLGKTGSGKTSTSKLIIEHVVAQGARVCVLDPIKSDWWGLTSSADGKHAGLPFHILGGPRGHVPLHAAAGKAIGEIVATGQLPLSIIDMADFSAGGLQQFFVDFAPTLLRKMRGVLYLVVEEAHEFAPKERSGIGAEAMAIHWAKKLATAGRSKGIRMILATQRTQSLHNSLLGSCDTLIAHRFTAPADQEPVVKWLKANLEPDLAKKVAASLSSLKTGQGWLCAGEAKIFECRQFPRIHTYDNTATPTNEANEHHVKTAPVDQDKLRTIIGDAVKEAEANDPKRLRERIAELERDLTKSKNSSGSLDTNSVKQAESQGYARGKIDGYQTGVTAIKPEIEKLAKVFNVLNGAVGVVTDFMCKVGEWEKRNSSCSPAPVIRQHIPAPITVRAAPREGSTLSRSQQVILDKLAWLESMKLYPAPKETLAAVCGVSPKSGGYFNNLGSLRSTGMIEYPQPGMVSFTETGRTQANPVVDDGQPIYEHWLRIVNNAQRDILSGLIEVYPKQLSKDDLAGVIGVSPSSGGYFNNLGRLRTLGAIDYPKPGFVALTKYVMP